MIQINVQEYEKEIINQIKILSFLFDFLEQYDECNDLIRKYGVPNSIYDTLILVENILLPEV